MYAYAEISTAVLLDGYSEGPWDLPVPLRVEADWPHETKMRDDGFPVRIFRPALSLEEAVTQAADRLLGETTVCGHPNIFDGRWLGDHYERARCAHTLGAALIDRVVEAAPDRYRKSFREGLELLEAELRRRSKV